MKNHDWNDLSLDYEVTIELNKIDQGKEEAYWKECQVGNNKAG